MRTFTGRIRFRIDEHEQGFTAESAYVGSRLEEIHIGGILQAVIHIAALTAILQNIRLA